MARGYRAGADDYMVKPFELEELLKHVKVLLEKRSRGETTRPADLDLESLD